MITDKVLWRNAYSAWLSSRGSDNTRRSYKQAWESLVASCGKPPWGIQRIHINTWIQQMRDSGVKAGTINQRLAGISSFFNYCNTKYLIPTQDGGETPLASYNPAASVDRPKDIKEQAFFMTSDEVRGFLDAIPRNTVQGLRDYALFACYAMTGRRNSEIRRLQWKHIKLDGNTMYYLWANKGKSRVDKMPDLARGAIVAYLGAAGKWGNMRPDDYIFTPLTDRALRLPTTCADTWTRNRALTGACVNHMVRKYAKKAGLDASHIHTHTFRHAFAEMVFNETHGDVRTVSRYLNHSSIAMTETYLNHLGVVRDDIGDKVATRLGG